MSNEYVYAAELDENNIVVTVIVLPSSIYDDVSANAYCKSIGIEGRFVLTAEDGSTRGKYAGIGDYYDPETDTFISPKREDSFV